MAKDKGRTDETKHMTKRLHVLYKISAREIRKAYKIPETTTRDWGKAYKQELKEILDDATRTIKRLPNEMNSKLLEEINDLYLKYDI